MLIWTSSISIWKKPNCVLLASHRLRSSGSLHRQTILKIWLRRLKGFGRVFGVSLFSQWECYSPVLEFLFLWSDNIDGLPLYMLQDGIILQGSRLVYTRNRHKKPPWPGDFKRWMRTVTKEHVISCSGSVWDGLRCNRWIASNDLFRKKCLLTIVESHKKDHTRPRTKWRKTSESAYPTNVLGSIVLTLSLFKILNNNMFVVIYVSCYQLH
ncbi:hypothetical protein IGI04_015669 [Brassica rapa subsp. trilocularis]|uniref:Uncharacterized protein n=1 Tax=Brassica rapa subsp. trilocularis TaxID=1813537 RepID=A0ABQ7MQW2_BRACM|nr:hypothetical protein IGI04_015669 [Brassica rapa subsp. trilocularis]